MRNILIVLLIATFVMIIAGCSESTSPAKDPELKIVGEMNNPTVKLLSSIKKHDDISSETIDSIRIVKIRILVSEMKVFVENESTSAGKVMKSEPFVYDITGSGNEVQLAEGIVTIGKYDRIKFEFHRFSEYEANQYQTEPDFIDFATADRYSILIEGITYSNGDPSIFTFRSKATSNLFLNLDPPINISGGSNTKISIQCDPNDIFIKWNSILDPNDPANAKDIENSLINTIKAMKK